MSNEVKLPDFIKDWKVIVITESGNDRVAWKKFFKDLGISLSNIEAVEQFDEATKKLKEKTYHIIMGTQQFKGIKTDELFLLFYQRNHKPLERLSVLIAEEKRNEIEAFYLDNEIDILLYKPYTVSDLHKSIKETIQKKCSASPTEINVAIVKEEIERENFSKAKEKVDSMRGESDNDGHIPYLIALMAEKEGRKEEAQDFYKISIELDKNNYKGLRNLIRLYLQDQKFQDCIPFLKSYIQLYPIAAKDLSSFLRAGLIGKEYDLIIDICSVASNGYKELNDASTPAIMAALTLAGESLAAQADHEKGKVALEKVVKFCRAKLPNIFHKALCGLLKINEHRFVYDFIQSLDDNERTPEIINFEFIAIANLDQPKDVINRAMDLIKKNLKTVDLYRYLIEAAIKMGMKSERVDDYLFEAVRTFPDQKKFFESLIIPKAS